MLEQCHGKASEEANSRLESYTNSQASVMGEFGGLAAITFEHVKIWPQEKLQEDVGRQTPTIEHRVTSSRHLQIQHPS